MAKTILSTSHSNSEPGTTVAGTTEYWLFGYAAFEKSTTEATREVLYRAPGTLSKLYVRLTANNTSTNGSVTIRKNGADTALTVTVTAGSGAVVLEDSDTVSVAAGDKLCIKTVSGGTGTFTMTMVSCIWEATTNTNVRYVAKGYSVNQASATNYLPIGGDRSGTSGTEANVENTIKTAGTIKNGSVNVTANARTNNTVFAVRKNRADTTMVITVAAGVTGHREDTTNSISYAVDDELDWRLTTLTGTPALAANSFAVDYETTTNRGVLTRGCVGSSADFIQDTDLTWYVPIGGGNREAVTTEADVQMKAREAFTFRNLVVYSNANTIAVSTTVALRVNGVTTALSASFGAAATGFVSDTSDTITVAAGDLINFIIITDGGVGQTISIRQIGITTELVAVNNVIKSLATETVTIGGGTVACLAAKNRALTTETITISDSVTQIVTPAAGGALQTKMGSFAKSTGANGTTQQITVGFQAKTIIFWWTEQTAEGYTDAYKMGIGFSDSTATAAGCKAMSIVSDDAQTAANAARYEDDDKCIKWGSAGLVTEQESYVSAIDSTSFTLTHSTNQAVATIIHYMAVGGTAIANSAVGSFNTNTAAGAQQITSLSFQPDLVLFLCRRDATLTNQGSGGLMLGMTTGPSNEGCIAVTSEDARNPPDTWRLQRTDLCLTTISPSSGAITGTAEFTQFLSNGFELNWTLGDTAAPTVAFLAIKGGSPVVDTVLQPTSNGVQTCSTAASKTPKGIMLFSANKAATTTSDSTMRISIGGTDLTSEGCIWGGDTDNTSPTVVAQRTTTTKALSLSTEAATGSSSTTNAEADIDSFNSGNFKLNWTTTDATQRQVLFLALHEPVAGAAVERALATETVTLSDTRTRLAAKNRPLTTQTVALSENLIRIKGKVKSLATETVTITGGTLARLLSKLRTADDTTTISETRQRLGSKSRPLSTQTVALSESVQRIKSKIKALATETITIGGGTAARLSSKIRAISLQTVVLTDNRTRLKGGMRTVATQTVVLSESVARTVARQVIRALATQTVALGESIARLKASQRTIPQTITTGENISRLSAKLRAIVLQTVALSESRTRIKGAVKTISQTVLLSENISRLSVKLRAVAAQTVALADSVTRQIIGGAVEIIRSLSQTVVISEIVARRLSALRALSETIPKAETLARIKGKAKVLSQTIAVSEQAARIKSSLRLISQTVAASDSINRLNALRRTVIQTTLLAENVARETVGNLVRSIVQTVTVSDSIARRTVKLVILAQTVVIVEQASRLSTKLRAIPAQTITLSDSATNELNVIIKNVLKTISQVTAISDYARIEVVKKSQRFRKILQPSIKRLISNHPAWLLGTRGMHNDYEEFSP